MTLQSEIAPVVEALQDRDTPVSPSEALGLIGAVVQAASRHVPAEGDAVLLGSSSVSLSRDHLDEAIDHVEQAANEIVTAAEAILGTAGLDPEIRSHCMRMLEACAFQDIVSQRLMIVRQLLAGHMPEKGFRTGTRGRVRSPARRDESGGHEERLLNGPGLGEDALGQDAIDAMFPD